METGRINEGVRVLSMVMRVSWCLVLVLFFTADREAWACSCVPQSPCAQFQRVNAVFLGRVVDVQREGGINRVRMEVVRTYKGQVAEHVTVSNEAGTSCSFTFTVGERFLLFGFGSGQTFSTQMCAGGGTLPAGAPEPELPWPGGRVEGDLRHVNPTFTSFRDYTSPAGRGVRVWIDTAAGKVETTTDADGRFRLDAVPVGRHVVRADVGPALEGSQPIHLRSSSDCALVLIVTRASGGIAGVLTSKAAAVGGAEIVAIPVRHDWTSRDQSDAERAIIHADGSFELRGLEAGSYFLTVNVLTRPTVKHPFAPTYYPGVSSRAEATVIEVGQSPALVRPFVLERTLARTTITAEVSCEDSSLPRSSVVYAIASGGGGFESTYTKVDGRFQLPVIAGVPYDVQGSLSVPARDAAGREVGVQLVRTPSARVAPGSTAVARLVAPLTRCHETTRD